MERRRKARRRLRRWQRDAAAVAFSLFPMLVMAGLFSPAVVHVEEEPAGSGRTRPRIVKFASHDARRPLLIPRDFSGGFLPELVDLQSVFRTGGTGVSEDAKWLARLLAFPRHDSDTIVLDDVHGALPGFLFDDVLSVTPRPLVVAAYHRPFDDPILASHGPGYVPFLNGGSNFTAGLDPPPPPPPIPEPATGPLLGAGLALLAGRRRARRSRRRAQRPATGGAERYFQPIGS